METRKRDGKEIQETGGKHMKYEINKELRS
jgi:hypothetical protein